MPTINAINSNDPVEVAKGGTGASSLTAYAIICGGTTGAGVVQSIASVGTSGQVLTSNGAAALPTFQDVTFNSAAEVVSADPGGPTDGDFWLNTTGDDFKGQANSVTVTFTVT
jgi:hypothetical protein